MGRQPKEKLDWFKVDADMFHNQKIKHLRALSGNIAVLVWIELLAEIYGGKGYYFKWNDTFATIFSDERKITKDEIDAILESIFVSGLFDRDKYDRFGILTSVEIQRRYFTACAKRDVIIVVEDYLYLDSVLNLNKSLNIHEKMVYSTENGISSTEKDISAEEMGVSGNINTQSRVEKSREEHIYNTCSNPPPEVEPGQPALFEGQEQIDKQDIREEMFDELWDNYPRKQSKAEAKKKFMKLKPTMQMLEKMLRSLEAYKETDQWQIPQYIPLASTWLNQKRFEDDIEEIKKSGKSRGRAQRGITRHSGGEDSFTV